MKVVEQSYQILQPYFPTQEGICDGFPECLNCENSKQCFKQGIKYQCKVIEQAARTCYKSEDKMTPESHIKMIGTLNERFHQAPLEFGNLVVKFFTNRGVLAEITRHRLASFAVESTRYCNYSKGKFDSQVTFVRPSYWKELTPDQKRVWEEDCKDCEKKYLYRIETGWTPEQARGCLNMDAKTEINLSANFREWKHIFHLRVDSAAHPDIRALLNPLYEEMSELAPFVFKDNFLDNQSTSKFIAYLKLADDPKEVYNLFYKRFGNDNMAIMDFCKKVLKVEPLSEEGEIESVLEDMYQAIASQYC